MVVSSKNTSRESKNDRKSLKRSEQESKIRRQTTYTLRKPYDYIRSLNKKTPSKKEGVAIGDSFATNFELLFTPEYYKATMYTYQLAKTFLQNNQEYQNINRV